MARKPAAQESDAEQRRAYLSRIRATPEAKALRAAAIHYGASRQAHGVGHPMTDDAEANLYVQMFNAHPAACAALGLTPARGRK